MNLFEETNESELKEIHSHHTIATKQIDYISIDGLVAEELNSDKEFMDDEELIYSQIEEYYE